jgi:hypothetical protein
MAKRTSPADPKSRAKANEAEPEFPVGVHGVAESAPLNGVGVAWLLGCVVEAVVVVVVSSGTVVVALVVVVVVVVSSGTVVVA